MKKKQKKTKVEVVEPVSVANQCDYQRGNGKCGRALCDNFGKPCTGRACEDWKCEAEGYKCLHAGGKGFCTDHTTNGGEAICRDCKVFNANGTGDYSKTAAVAVVEPRGGAVGMTEQDVAAGIARQLQVIEDAEKNAQFERVKLGVVLIRWEQYLGDGRGRGKSGGGLKGWLAANVPTLSYETARSYKDQAKKAVEMLGGGARAQAVLLDEPTVTQPDGEVIEIEPEFVAKRDKIFEDVKSRRQLEQTYFKFMAHEGKGRQGGANKGQSGTGRRALTVEEKSDAADVEIRELIGKIIAFDKSGKFRMLTAQAQSDIVLYLKDAVKSFEEQQS